MRYARSLAGLLLGAVLVSCGGSDPTSPRVPAGIVMTPNQPVLGQGLSDTLRAIVVDANGRAINGQTVTFTSADTTVARVTGALGTVGIVVSAVGIFLLWRAGKRARAKRLAESASNTP